MQVEKKWKNYAEHVRLRLCMYGVYEGIEEWKNEQNCKATFWCFFGPERESLKKHWNHKVFQQRRTENEKVENESRISGGQSSEPNSRAAVLYIVSTLRLRKALRVISPRLVSRSQLSTFVTARVTRKASLKMLAPRNIGKSNTIIRYNVSMWYENSFQKRCKLDFSQLCQTQRGLF